MEVLSLIMIAADYFRRKYLEPLIEKQREERRKRNFEIGRAEGIAEVDAEWLEWLDLERKAKAAGKPFDVPTPAERRAKRAAGE